MSDAPVYDLVIIGVGSAAGAAAAEARRLGHSVAWVERGRPGGTCVNVGCVPSKTLLAAAADRAAATSRRFDGLHTEGGSVDLAALVADKERLLDMIRDNLDLRPERWGVTSYTGTGSFAEVQNADEVAVEVSGPDGVTVIHGRNVLVSTGAAAFIPPIPGLDGVDYLTSSTAMSLSAVPASLLVIGANAVGLEQAQLFAQLGAEVTVVEVAPRIAPLEPPAMSAALQEALTAQGIRFVTDARITGVEATAAGMAATVETAAGAVRLEAERVLVATGRRPVTEGLRLDAVGVATGARGEIVVDEHLRTAHPRIWAAGDVVGRAQFVYVGVAQGKLVAANALTGASRALDESGIPRVTFTSPAIASVGLTAVQAAEAGHTVAVRELPMAAVSRPLVSKRTAGLITLVSDAESDRILGVQMVGYDAGEVIAAATYLLAAQGTVQQLATSWAPYLTTAEALQLVAATEPVA